jgi:hypothetical protein
MSTILKRIGELTEERQHLYAIAGERWLTPAEQARIAEIAAALDELWAQRREELAKGPVVDHELVVVAELKERTV